MKRPKLRVLDLFSGIGGIALGLERTGGFVVKGFSEVEEFRTRVLNKHWPHVPVYGDVRAIKAETLGFIPDWIVGGPPCHRTSIAAAIHGKRTGETLWPEQLRLIKECNPRGTIVEQPVKNAEWERTVSGDLAEAGYQVSRYVIEAYDVGAPHSRKRVFFVAHRYGSRLALPGATGPSEVIQAKGASLTRGHWSPDNARTIRMDDGLSSGMDRSERIKACGSSCVPQIGTVLGYMILESFK
jgi:DNA (cytosine-5)-methyltransferase 1